MSLSLLTRYDPGWRFEAEVDHDVEPCHLYVATGADRVVPIDRVGVLHLATIRDLDVWWIGGDGGGPWCR